MLYTCAEERFPEWVEFSCPTCGESWMAEMEHEGGCAFLLHEDESACPECGEEGFESWSGPPPLDVWDLYIRMQAAEETQQ